MNCPNCHVAMESAKGQVLKKRSGVSEEFNELPQTIYLCHQCKGAWSQEGNESDDSLKEIRRPQQPAPKKPLPQGSLD